jgi:hypothetical protein
MSPQYRVLLLGPKPDQSADAVIDSLTALFKLGPEQVRNLLRAPRTVIKTGIDLQTAAKYQAALEQRGCMCLVEPEGAATSEQLPVDPPKASSAPAPGAAQAVAAPPPPPPPSSALVFCRGCGKGVHETAPMCPHCGAPQGTAAAAGKAGYSSYDQVPWYRKNWFAILTFLFFWPGLLVVLLSGDVYYESKGQLKTYSTFAKVFLIGWCLLVLAALLL